MVVMAGCTQDTTLGTDKHAMLADENPGLATEAAAGRYKIAAAARAVGLSDHRIREYERAGLIRPAREARTGDRLFAASEIRQLRLIKRLIHERGFTLPLLRDCIRRTPCWKLVDCAEVHRCPVPRDALTPCYVQRLRGVAVACDTECARCAIYCCRGEPPPHIVLPPRREPTSAGAR